MEGQGRQLAIHSIPLASVCLSGSDLHTKAHTMAADFNPPTYTANNGPN